MLGKSQFHLGNPGLELVEKLHPSPEGFIASFLDREERIDLPEKPLAQFLLVLNPEGDIVVSLPARIESARNLENQIFPVLIPERLIVEMTAVGLLHRVVDVLHIHEDRDSIHGEIRPDNQRKGLA